MSGRFSHRALHFLENLSDLGAVVMFVSMISVLPARSQGIPVDSTLSISGSVEVYVAHDFSGSGINNGPGFFYASSTGVVDVNVSIAASLSVHFSSTG